MQVLKLKKNYNRHKKKIVKDINEINNIHFLYFTKEIKEKYKNTEKNLPESCKISSINWTIFLFFFLQIYISY